MTTGRINQVAAFPAHATEGLSPEHGWVSVHLRAGVFRHSGGRLRPSNTRLADHSHRFPRIPTDISPTPPAIQKDLKPCGYQTSRRRGHSADQLRPPWRAYRSKPATSRNRISRLLSISLHIVYEHKLLNFDCSWLKAVSNPSLWAVADTQLALRCIWVDGPGTV
jgi:hypothetical protein